MQDQLTTHIWMGGVMMVMLTYGVIALAGFARRRGKKP